MFTRRLVVQGAVLGFWSAVSIGQQTPPASSSPVLHEFPVILQQNVETGKTYYYYVRAVDNAGNVSPPSEVGSDTVP